MQGFEYPEKPHVRRHGPAGYSNYESYRDWLRDEFMFRCVYCLHRERWYGRATTFHIEHFIPVTVDDSGTCKYTNLLYACSTCNNAKTAILRVPDPCAVAFGDCLKIGLDGFVEASNDDGVRVTEVMRLNSDKNVDQRSRWMQTLAALQISDPKLFDDWMAFPNDLPDLRPPAKQPPQNNSLPQGVENCYFVQREQNRLPATY